MLFPGNSDYRGRHAGEYVPPRRRFRFLLPVLAIVAAIALVAWPFVEPYFPEVERRTIQSPDLPENIPELRIVFVSDIHAGEFFGPDRVAALVRRINGMNADIVLLGGDFAGDSDGAVAFFRNLPTIQARYGVYAVPGNHDRTVPESNLSLLMDAMTRSGVTPLVNEVASVRIGNATVWLAGLDDVSNGHPELDRVAARVRRGDFVIFLCHSPAIIPEALNARDADFQKGWFDLGLFGHTHGGQLGLGGGIVRDDTVPAAYRSGWTRVNRIDLLTSRGIGTSVLPIRFLCRPQIHVITVTRAD